MGFVAVAAPFEARAEATAPAGVEAAFEYTLDVVAPVAGARRDAYVLDNLDVSLRFDMARLTGWQDTTIFVHALNNSGDAPNDEIATLQGVDNIEVARQSARLYELWIERGFGPLSLRAGLYDLNSEFYSNESAALLIAPAFGIGSELAATGANGPSIFPSTALAVRAAFELSAQSQIKLAVLNAAAGVLGDPGGVDTSFDAGALIIGEWSWLGSTHINLGAWAYSDRQDDIRDLNLAGDPQRRRAYGAYITLERLLIGEAGAPRALSGFLRVGASEGDTTPFDGGWQAGLVVQEVWDNRPASVISIGVNQGYLSAKYQANERDLGALSADAESALEVTYADTIGHLTIQPDIQFIHQPGGARDRDDVVVTTLRFSAAF
ncbi:carbohydrate porin [Candidatus Viadribacter manganicus]|uniref:carbohydrate porin n=1 Tax=Candidatus Viadribacter manganicus TaxID=1759059 RepID=UPI001D17A6E3|nr:carbohydrate porin [Candidatus Viadribacter manganicus]